MLDKTSNFDVVEYLTDETLIIPHLNEVLVLADGAPSEFIQALNDVARAKDVKQRNRDKTRESL